LQLETSLEPVLRRAKKLILEFSEVTFIRREIKKKGREVC
jgi:hypothetical protein